MDENQPADSTQSTRLRARTRANPEKRRREFVAALRESANVRSAAAAAGIDRQTAYNWRKELPDFARAWDDAIEDAIDTLEVEAIRRARDGVTKPVYQQKEHVGDVQEYSDTLMVVLLKAHRPAKYRERVEVDQTNRTAGAPQMVSRIVINRPAAGDAPGQPEEAAGA